MSIIKDDHAPASATVLLAEIAATAQRYLDMLHESDAAMIDNAL